MPVTFAGYVQVCVTMIPAPAKKWVAYKRWMRGFQGAQCFFMATTKRQTSHGTAHLVVALVTWIKTKLSIFSF